MEEFLSFIVTSIVDHPKKVKITTDKSEDPSVTSYLIAVAPEDMGKIIGKNGKIIKAIRNLAQILSYKQKKRVLIKIKE